MQLYNRIERRVAFADDSETKRSQKTISIFLMLAGGIMTLLNVLTYLFLGSISTAFAYLLLVIFVPLCALVILAYPRWWVRVAFAAIVGSIFFNMAALISAGGYQAGLETAVWMMVGPIAASFFFSPRWTALSLAVFILAAIIAAFLEPFAQANAPAIATAERMRIATTNLVIMAVFICTASLYLIRQVEFYRQRTEELIQNMLPRPIAARLKVSQETIADAYEEVTVLFADMVGSTPLFAGLKPAEAVDWLNEVFLMFDDLVEKYGLEKIRTIGDNYMVAAGVPMPRADHAQAIIQFALEMLQGLENIPARGGKKMAFRVGINSGPLVAGVIGRAKYQYDLWGDTVNIAARMESSGEPGRVHISQATYELIHKDFECISRGIIPIKGKGEMETWFVNELEQGIQTKTGS